MKSQEVVAIVKSLQSEGEADRTDGLSGGTLEASSLAELVEESHVGAKVEGRKKGYQCKFCGKIFEKGQALGGHMNGHPEDRNHERMMQYEKLLQKMNPRLFMTVNPREHMPETSSYPISNFTRPGDGFNVVSHVTPMQPARLTEQPWQQMEPSQAWHPQTSPVDSQQLRWPQASSNVFNSRGVSANYFTNMPNPPTTYVASDAAVKSNYGPAAMDPSLSGLPTQYSLPAPSSMSTTALYGNSAPCRGSCCKPSGSGPYQDPQMNMHSLHTLEQRKNSSSTLNRNQPRFPMPPNVQMNNSSYVQHVQDSPISGMGTQEMTVQQGTRLRPNPSDAYDSGSNHSPIFDQWSGSPTDNTF